MKGTELAPTSFQIEAQQVENAVSLVLAWPVASQTDLDDLGGGLKECTARVKWLEAQRQERIGPLLEQVEEIRAEYREVESAYKKLKEAFSTRTVRYHREQREAEARARAEALAVQQTAHAAAQAGQYQAAQALQSTAYRAMAGAPLAMKTEGVHTRKTWKVEIANPVLVPREFCEPSAALALEHVRKLLGKASEAAPEAIARVVQAMGLFGISVTIEEKAVGK